MGIVAERVRARREQLNLTQEDLAERSGVGQATIARIETGETRSPKGDTERALARALKTSVEYLSGEADAESPPAAPAAPTAEAAPPPHEPEDDETPIETALYVVKAEGVGRYLSADFDAARRAIRESHRFLKADADPVDVARGYMEAARSLWSEGLPVTSLGITTRMNTGKLDAAQKARADERARALNDEAAQRARDLGYGSPGEVESPLTAAIKRKQKDAK